jgi:hypothetical protein
MSTIGNWRGPNIIKDGLNHAIKNKIVIEVNLPEGSKFIKKTPDGYNDFKTFLPLKCLEVKELLTNDLMEQIEVILANKPSRTIY